MAGKSLREEERHYCFFDSEECYCLEESYLKLPTQVFFFLICLAKDGQLYFLVKCQEGK